MPTSQHPPVTHSGPFGDRKGNKSHGLKIFYFVAINRIAKKLLNGAAKAVFDRTG
jgi:hypothetical protein